MGGVTRFAAVFAAGAVLAACDIGQGGEGEKCKSAGWLGPSYCDSDLICNTAAGYVCQRPKSRHENQSCDANALCADGLWCDTVQSKCAPFLHEGDACLNPFSCGPDLVCGHTCMQPPDAGTPRANVTGTVMLPGNAQARGLVEIYSTLPPAGMPMGSTATMATGAPTLTYSIVDVPAGTYFVRCFIDVDRSLGTVTAGDYEGWYGGAADGSPPDAANAVVPDTGSVRFDFSLAVR
jgi:hypothetical protein